MLKGILTAEDARLAVEHGVDAIVVSNHGARQLDRVAATADVLPEIVAAVDGRARCSSTAASAAASTSPIALALGASGVLVGRPLLWALATPVRAGRGAALAILREEFEIALALLGAATVGDLTRVTSGGPSAT